MQSCYFAGLLLRTESAAQQFLLLLFAGNLLIITRTLYLSYPVRSDSTSPLNQISSNLLQTSHQRKLYSKHSADSRASQWTGLGLSTNSGPSDVLHRRLFSVQAESLPLLEHLAPKRHFTPRNQVFGGVFLHLTRHADEVSCKTQFSEKLAGACHNTRGGSKVTRSMPPLLYLALTKRLNWRPLLLLCCRLYHE